MPAGLEQPAVRWVSLSSGPRFDLFPACVKGRWLRLPFGAEPSHTRATVLQQKSLG
ncbi:MAG: hypothetical protein KTR25_13130 [Myxococcales bacterium]|nr:hypothetical protein [Myxococcales bacterium]